MPGSNLRQLAPAVFPDPLKETLHRVQIRSLGMLVPQGPEKEFLRGEDGICARTMDDFREASGQRRGKNSGRRGQSRSRGHGFPGIKKSDPESVEILHVARDQGEIVLERGSREQTVYR